MAVHGKDIVWFGRPGERDRIPRKDLNVNYQKAEAAFKKVDAMLYHHRSKQALRDRCYPTDERPWIHGERKYLEIYERHWPSVKPGMREILRAASSAAKIEKMEGRLDR